MNFATDIAKKGKEYSPSKVYTKITTKPSLDVKEITDKTSKSIGKTTSATASKIAEFGTYRLPSCILSEALIKRTTSEQRNLLKELFIEYQKLSSNKITHPFSKTISKGSLLHGTTYDYKNLDNILKNGLISPDIASSKSLLRTAYGEQRTIGGLDTWINDTNRTIGEYFNTWLATPPEFSKKSKLISRDLCWRGENKFIDLGKGGKQQKSIAFIINPEKNKELQAITKFGVTPQTAQTESNIIKGDMVKMYSEEAYKRHTFIPVGIPSNYIEKIVVGDNLGPKQVAEIKSLIKKYNLDTKVCNTKGKLL